MSERDPEMIERVRKALDDELDFYDFLAPTRAQITSACVAFARAEVRRALESLRKWIGPPSEQASRKCIVEEIGARLRELRGETEQNTATLVPEGSQRGVAPRDSGLREAVSREANTMSAKPSDGRQEACSGLAATLGPGSSERPKLDAGTPAIDSASTVERGPQRPEVAGSTPAPGATLRERAERLLVCIPEPTFRKWAVDNAVALANDEADRAAQEMEAKMDEELHAVRMEAQTLREANEAWSFANGKLIGWIKWRQAWTGGNDPRDLSGTRWDICALRGDAPPRGFKQSKVAAGSRAPERVENAQADMPAPALSDADVLERAADVLDKSTTGLSGVVREVAAKLRAAPPAPSADWIERMALECVHAQSDYPEDDKLVAFLRARLEPVEENLELILKNGDAYVRADAKRALSILRGEVTP